MLGYGGGCLADCRKVPNDIYLTTTALLQPAATGSLLEFYRQTATKKGT